MPALQPFSPVFDDEFQRVVFVDTESQTAVSQHCKQRQRRIRACGRVMLQARFLSSLAVVDCSRSLIFGKISVRLSRSERFFTQNHITDVRFADPEGLGGV